MPEKLGNGGHSQEAYDPETGKYTEDGKPNKYYDNKNEQITSAPFNKIDGSSDDDDDDFFDIFADDDDDRSFEQMLEDLINKGIKTREYAEKIGEKYGFKLIENDHSIEEDILKINKENYDLGYSSNYHRNCASCSLTYALRRLGLDVEAQKRKKEIATGISSFYKNNRYGKTIHYCPFLKSKDPNNNDHDGRIIWKSPVLGDNNMEKMSSDSYFSAFKDELKKYPEGTVFLMANLWTKTSGHAWNAEIRAGEILWVDSQIGRIIDDEEASRRINSYHKSGEFIELNDKEFVVDGVGFDSVKYWQDSVINLVAKKRK